MRLLLDFLQCLVILIKVSAKCQKWQYYGNLTCLAFDLFFAGANIRRHPRGKACNFFLLLFTSSSHLCGLHIEATHTCRVCLLVSQSS